jgi:hypothetical protein
MNSNCLLAARTDFRTSTTRQQVVEICEMITARWRVVHVFQKSASGAHDGATSRIQHLCDELVGDRIHGASQGDLRQQPPGPRQQ